MPVSPSVTHGTSLHTGFTRALLDSLPLSVSVFAYGTVYGTLARSTNHLPLIQTMAMSIFVFAGASQFTILALLHQGARLWTIVGSTFLINSRQILYGVTLGQVLKHIPRRHLAWISYGLTDESYSVATVRAAQGAVRVPYLAGAGMAIFGPWLLSSALGYELGGFIGNPARFGLTFAYIGAFMGLLVAQLHGRRHSAAALLAAIGATAIYPSFGLSGAVFVGATLAFLTGVVIP